MWNKKEMTIDPSAAEKGIRKFNLISGIIKKVVAKLEPIPPVDMNGKPFDTRNTQFIAYLFDIKQGTPEEMEAQILADYKRMTKAFLTCDEKVKKEYLDRIYDTYEQIPNLLKNGIHTEEDFYKASAITLLEQPVFKYRDQNLDYFSNRYNTEAAQEKFGSIMFYQKTVCANLAEFRTQYPDFALQETINKDLFVRPMDEMNKSLAEGLETAVNEKTNIVNVDVPDFIYRQSKESIDKIETGIVMPSQFFEMFSSKAMMKQEASGGLVQLDPLSCAFIGDKSLRELAVENLRNTSKYRDPSKPIDNDVITRMSVHLINQTLVKGDRQLSIAVPVYDKEKGVLPKLYKIKPKAESILKSHHPFRRMFFNWGPFKIKPEQSDIDKTYASNAGDERILSSVSQTIKAAIDKGKGLAQAEAANTKAQALMERSKLASIRKANEYLEKIETLGSVNNNLNADPQTVKESSSEQSLEQQNEKFLEQINESLSNDESSHGLSPQSNAKTTAPTNDLSN